MNFTEISIRNFKGCIPAGADLVIIEREDVQKKNYENAIVLYGFDEVGQFDNEFKNPVYGFLSFTK